MGKKKVSKKEKEREQAEEKRIELEKLKQKQIEDELEQRKRDIEMAEERQKQEIVENNLRKQQLQESLSYFQDFRDNIHEIQLKFKKQQDWLRYMRCNGLPNVNQAGDLRDYLGLWKDSEIQTNINERNWLLQTNEKTLLTQNKDVPNLTVSNVKAAQKNIGIVFAERIREVLHILMELQTVITEEPNNLNDFTLKDLKNIRTEMRVNLAAYYDQLAFTILRNIDRDMVLSSSATAKYVFESDIFKTQLQTVRDIPQPQLTAKEKLKEESRHTEIEFELLKLNVNLPPTIKLFKAAVRALWLKFDHFSDYCASYFMPKAGPAFYQRTLAECTQLEWKKREEIKEIANKELSKSDPANAAVQSSLVSNVIDIDKVYTEFEEEQLALKKRLKGPESMKLQKTEINLRSHRIVGGIYCIDYLEQPKQNVKICNSRAFLTTIQYSTLKKKDFYQSYSPPVPPKPGVRRLPEEIEAEIKQMEQNLDKLVLVNIQLPDNVLWFEPPLVCRWEYPEEAPISTSPEEDETQEINNICTCSREKSEGMNKTRKTNIFKDFNLLDIPPQIDLYEVMSVYIMPRLPDGYKIKSTALPSNRRGSLMKYSSKESPTAEAEPSNSSCLDDILEPTNSPRNLHPVNQSRRAIKVIKEFEELASAHLENADNTENALEETEFQIKPVKKKGVYMFSELLSDLEKIKVNQKPKFEFKVKEAETGDEPVEVTKAPSKHFSKLVTTTTPPSKTRTDDKLPVQSCTSCNCSTERKNSMGHWSNRDVHDVKFNEDKLLIQFRTGRLGYFGLAANRYSNLPFQTWELKPEKTPNCVSFTLTAAVVSIDLTVSEEGLRLNSMQGCSTAPFQQIIGTILSLDELKKMLKESAVDLFPEEDAFCYTEGSCEKHMVMESHLYDCIGAVALTHNFSWSRWNLLAGSRIAVLLMREFIESRKPANHQTLLVTPLKTTIVDCTEVSASFNTSSVAGMEFYADLYHLTLHHSHPTSMRKQEEMNLSLRENVVQVLKVFRPLSFC